MRRRLHGTQAACDTFSQHHPVLYIRVRGLGPSRQLNHRVRLVRRA